MRPGLRASSSSRQAGEEARRRRLDDHVGALCELAEEHLTARLGDIQGDAPLAGVEVPVEERNAQALVLVERRELATEVTPGPVIPDDIGPEIRQQLPQ